MTSILLRGRGQRGNPAGRSRGRGRGRGGTFGGTAASNSTNNITETASNPFEKERQENAAKRENKGQAQVRGGFTTRGTTMRGGAQGKQVRFNNDGTKAQSGATQPNPFAQNNNPFAQNPSQAKPAANPFGGAAANPFSSAASNSPNPFGAPANAGNPFQNATSAPSVTPNPFAGANAAMAGTFNAQPPATVSSNTLAGKIDAVLKSNRISPPAWPASPGEPRQKDVMEKFWHSYKDYRAKARACLIKNALLDDPDKPKKLSEAIDFKGTCEDMCPEFEKITRIVEHDVQGAEKETKPDGTQIPCPSNMIKALARSAAGQDAPLPADVRSPAALRRTLDYLINTILGENDLATVHGFLWNRTRAIRRDFTFQQSSMNPEELLDQVYCLERIARFHVIALHQMSGLEEAAEDFSEQQELEQLGKTLLSLIHAYEDCKLHNLTCDNEAEFRAYYVLFNSENTSILETVQDWGWRFWGESEDVRTAVSLSECLRNIWTPVGPLRPHQSLEIAQNAFSRYFTIIQDPNVSYTMACFAEIHFNKLREAILTTILTAYQMQKGQTKDWTVDNLNIYLHFDEPAELIGFVEAYNLSFEILDGQLCLSFKSFADMEKPHPPLRQPFSQSTVERKRGQYSLPDVIHETVYEEIMADDAGFEQMEQSSDAVDLTAVAPQVAPVQTGVIREIQENSMDDGKSLFVPETIAPAAPLETPSVAESPKKGLGGSVFDSNPPAKPASSLSWSIFAAPTAPSASTTSNSPFSFTAAKPAAATEPKSTALSRSIFANTSTTPSASPFSSFGPKPPPSQETAAKPALASSVFAAPSSAPSSTAPTPSPFAGFAPKPVSSEEKSSTPSLSSSMFAGPTVSKPSTPVASQKEVPKPTFSFLSSSSSKPDTPAAPSLFGGSTSKATDGTTKQSTAEAVEKAVSTPEQPVSLVPSPTAVSAAPAVPVAPPITEPAQNTTLKFSFGQPAAASVEASTNTQAKSAFAFPSQPSNTDPTPTPKPLSNPTPTSLVATEPTPVAAPAPKKEDLTDLARWYTLGRGGIVDDFIAYTIDTTVSQVMEQFEKEKAKEQEKVEAQLRAEADDFRQNSLAVKYFYRWQDNARRLRMRRKGREARELRKQMAESMRQSTATRPSLLANFEASSRGSKRRGSGDELLRTSVLNGVNDVSTAITSIYDQPASSAPTSPASSFQGSTSSLMLRRTSSLRSDASDIRPSRKISKVSKMIDRAKRSLSHSRSQSESRFRRSLISNSSSLNGSVMLQDSLSKGRRQASGVKTDYFRLKARGITTLPDGTPLASSAAYQLPLNGRLSHSLSRSSLGSPRSTPAPIDYEKDVEDEPSRPITSITDIEALKARAKKLMEQDKRDKSPQKRVYKDEDDEDELFAKAKRVREQMEEGASWYKTEMAKLSASPS